jgi:hypothetical protein
MLAYNGACAEAKHIYYKVEPAFIPAAIHHATFESRTRDYWTMRPKSPFPSPGSLVQRLERVVI